MSHLPDLLDATVLPVVLVAVPRVVEAVVFAVAASVSLWSRNSARRAEARRLMRTIRRRSGE
jgi:hypothetical protein